MQALPIIGAIGAIGSLFQGQQANKTARGQLGIQNRMAGNQEQLFQASSPVYQQLLQALAGFNGLQGTQGMVTGVPALPAEGVLGRIIQHGQGGVGHTTYQPWGGQAGADPSAGLAQSLLGPGATGADLGRYQTLQEGLGRNIHNAFQNQAFNMGTRGLFGSSIDASGRAALATQGAQAQTELQRQSMQDAQNNAMQRYGLLLGALNPGLNAGPAGANIAANAGQQAAQMGQYYGNQASGALNGFLQYQAMHNAMGKYGFGGGAGGNSGFSYLPGAGNTVNLGGNYSVQLPPSISPQP